MGNNSHRCLKSRRKLRNISHKEGTNFPSIHRSRDGQSVSACHGKCFNLQEKIIWVTEGFSYPLLLLQGVLYDWIWCPLIDWSDTHIWKDIPISECCSSWPISECFCGPGCRVAHKVTWHRNTTSVPTVNKTINPRNRMNYFFFPNDVLSNLSLCQKNNKRISRLSNTILIFLFISEKEI